jgi:hypothetical protein
MIIMHDINGRPVLLSFHSSHSPAIVSGEPSSRAVTVDARCMCLQASVQAREAPPCRVTIFISPMASNNHKRADLAGNTAAREDAVALARDLKHGAAMPGWDWAGWFTTVDLDSHKVDEVPIADA